MSHDLLQAREKRECTWRSAWNTPSDLAMLAPCMLSPPPSQGAGVHGARLVRHNCERKGDVARGRQKGVGVLSDLAALTPPLIVAAAFVIGVVLFLRRQLGSAASSIDDDDDAEIPDGHGNADLGDHPAAPSADHRK